MKIQREDTEFFFVPGKLKSAGKRRAAEFFLILRRSLPQGRSLKYEVKSKIRYRNKK